jgi:drug/metabolite transporter (DMT)-like permease
MNPVDATPAAHRTQVAKAAAWMAGALLSFMAMALGGRELSADLSTFQILFFRSVVGLLIVGALLARRGAGAARTARPGLHVGRNLAHFVGQFGWFFAIASLPLAEVFAIEFTIPIWAALLSAVFLAERLTPPRLLALALGFGGVLLIVRPGSGLLHAGAVAALVGAIGYAVSYVCTKRLTATDSALAILFYMTLVQLPLGLAGALWQWQPASWAHLPWVVVVGVTALSAHYCLARALVLADLTLVLPMDFLRLPLAAALGFALYGETVDALAIAGSVLIVAANVSALRPAAPAAPAPTASTRR